MQRLLFPVVSQKQYFMHLIYRFNKNQLYGPGGNPL